MSRGFDIEDMRGLSSPGSMSPRVLLASAACHQCTLVLIFLASITLMSLEVVYLHHIRKKGLHTSIFVVEILLDVLIFIDVVRRARVSKSCSKYLYDMWNWLDLLTLWIVAVHWIIVIVNPLAQVYSDAWIVLRYSINSIRVIYWMFRNVVFIRYKYYKKLSPNSANRHTDTMDAGGNLDWLPVNDLGESSVDIGALDGTDALFDEDDPWGPGGRVLEPEFVVEQYKAPNAVNADEAASREKKREEAERAAEAAEQARKLAEEKEMDDILGPPTDEEEPEGGLRLRLSEERDERAAAAAAAATTDGKESTNRGGRTIQIITTGAHQPTPEAAPELPLASPSYGASSAASGFSEAAAAFEAAAIRAGLELEEDDAAEFRSAPPVNLSAEAQQQQKLSFDDDSDGEGALGSIGDVGLGFEFDLEDGSGGELAEAASGAIEAEGYYGAGFAIES